MKIAILHNFMDNIGGAEMVSLTLARELDADIYTTNIDGDKIRKMGFADVLPRIHSIGAVPIQAPFRQQLSLWKFRRLNLQLQLPGKYDFFIISGDWAMSAAANNRPNLWYVHAPINEIWQFKAMVRTKMMGWWKRPFFDAWVWMNRRLTRSYAQSVGTWVANSRNTQKRIERFYGRSASVIYPPVYTKKYRHAAAQGYWLSVNRIVSHKRIEMQMDAFSRMPDERLVIVGSYEKNVNQFEKYRAEIEKKRPANVEIIHWADSEKLQELYAHCKGFITTTHNEDFGMTAVEAMASGKMIIAPDEGGFRESVANGVTGILIEDININKLTEAIKKTNDLLAKNPDFYVKKCLERAAQFDAGVFVSKIKEMISSKI